MNSKPDNQTQALVRHGVDAYAQALASAGGKELEALMCLGDRTALCAATYASPPYDLQVPALPVSRLSITLTPARVSGCLDGDRRQVFQTLRYAVFLAPAGTAARWHKEANSRHLSLYFHGDALADGDSGGKRPTLGGDPQLNVCVPGIRTLTDELVTELNAGPQWSAEAVDSLGRLLLIKVARHRAQHRARRNPLTPQLLGRLTDHVQANLSERILVRDLAAVVGLSPNHFAHAYTACTGQSPHQFVMAQRLHQAQALLQSGRESLADVAAACGFANQQHLTQVMRKQLGFTPARYRHQQQAGRHAHVPAAE